MTWTASDFARFGVTIAMLLGAAWFIEHKRSVSKLPHGKYSFRAVLQVVGVCSIIAIVITCLIYIRTDSLEYALSLGGIMIGVILIGSLRGFFSEYQLKRNGAKNLDKP